MYHNQAGHMSQPPSSPSPNTARSTQGPPSLRTANRPIQTSPQQRRQSSSSQQPPYPSYPIAIPAEKFAKALKLYTKYWLEDQLARRIQEPQSATNITNRLNIPDLKRSRSLNSPSSSRPYTSSVSNSGHEGVVDLSSVVSFTGEGSTSSATPNGSTELISYTGEIIRTRHRRPLSPVAKAKAALIRHLGSCWVCRSRRVQCPLDHQDIKSLDNARRAKARKRAQSGSTISSSSQYAIMPATVTPPASGGAVGQTNTLLGVGQAEQLQEIPSPNTPRTDVLSPTYGIDADPLAEIPSYGDLQNPANLPMSFANPDPYAGYQDNGMLALGVRRGMYCCVHLGFCQQAFEDAEGLETHFETAHFAYNRITPAHRYICSNCQTMNSSLSGACSYCRIEGRIEVWIYGKFIRIPTYQRFGPSGQDLLRNNSLAPFAPAMLGSMPSMYFGFGGGMNNDDFTTGDMDQGYDFQNSNSFENQDQGGDVNGYNTPRSGSYFQGNWTRQRAKASPLTGRTWYGKTLQTYGHQKTILLTLMLLVCLMLLCQSHEWLLTKVWVCASLISLPSHPNLPAVGFVGVLASFAICYTYWSIKSLGAQRVRKAQFRHHRCPLHDIPTLSFRYRRTAPNTFVRATVFS